jgi:hypothetical protein
MNKEKQRIAIAEACGWQHDKKSWYSPNGGVWSQRRSGGKWISVEDILPDYLNDLSDMHEAVMRLCYKKRLKCVCNSGLDLSWECILTESAEPNCIPCDGDHCGMGDTLCIAMAEAFLRTIGKWEDGE